MDPGINKSTKHNILRRFLWLLMQFIRAFPITEKPETPETLRQYIVWAKRQLGRPVKSVYSKGGPGSSTQPWKSSMTQLIVPGPDASSTNLAERGIQLRDMTKSVLVGSGLPRSFWPDALRNTVYVNNRVLCRTIDSRTPFELFYGKRPGIHHIRIFGALMYAYIPRALQKKIANNCEIGYSLGRIGTKVYFSQHHVARVVFIVRVNEDIAQIQQFDTVEEGQDINGAIDSDIDMEAGEEESSEADSDADIKNKSDTEREDSDSENNGLQSRSQSLWRPLHRSGTNGLKVRLWSTVHKPSENGNASDSSDECDAEDSFSDEENSDDSSGDEKASVKDDETQFDYGDD
ncbi:Integrase, catalytic core protein [Phytophthora megakarya]|uniref:Integrase, catalytic core protein n=1 Tax=Phytophthora megakarya TaxID=4795 RepID=A0A225WHD1_9STRA|nr:Integrase, catalytic core protein [Phytophthora megakarya]